MQLEIIREKFLLPWHRRLLLRSLRRHLALEYGVAWVQILTNGKELDRSNIGSKRKRYHRSYKGLVIDSLRGRDSIERASKSSWWEWREDSSLCFWRWTKDYLKDARDETKVFVKGVLPRYTKRQRRPAIFEDTCELIKKVDKVRKRSYIKKGAVKILTDFFGVPKIISSVERYIRVMCDATKCGLNEAVWAPNFYLPTVESALRLTDYDS